MRLRSHRHRTHQHRHPHPPHTRTRDHGSPPDGAPHPPDGYAWATGAVPSRPAWKSSNACFNSAWLFITNGP